MAGVHAVLTHEDVPGDKRYGLEFTDQPVLAFDRVRYFGEPVALVAAEHPRGGAEGGGDRGRVRAARARGRSRACGRPARDASAKWTEGAGYATTRGPTSCGTCEIARGDPDAEGEVSVEGHYERGIQDQAFLGPSRAWPSRTARAASTSTSPRSGCTSTVTRSRRASASKGAGADPSRRASGAPSAGARTFDADPRCDARAAH